MTPASIRFISPFSVPFRLGLDYWVASEMANKQAREGRRQEWRLIAPAKGPRLATAFQETRVLKSPKFKSEAENKVNMGERRHPPTPTSLHPKHEG
jgi:hypothetical protein